MAEQERKLSLESITKIISHVKDLIPTNVKDLNNDAGFITQKDAEEIFSGLDIDTTNLVTLDGVQTITGNKTFSGNISFSGTNITSTGTNVAMSNGFVNFANMSYVAVPNPSSNTDAANKEYVDNTLTNYVPISNVVSTAAPNKILSLNTDSKLDADITGTVCKTVEAGSTDYIINALIGTDDTFKIKLGEEESSGYVDIRIGENANEPIYITQYTKTEESTEEDTHRITLLDSNGNTSFPGDLTATRVFNAVYNDYAEFFERGEDTQPGDIIALDETADTEKYIKATNMSKVIVGVQSAEYAHIIGGKNISDSSKYIEENLKEFIPIGLAGRVCVNVQGNVNVGDYIGPSENPGVGKAYKRKTAKTVGIALTKNINNKCRILIK